MSSLRMRFREVAIAVMVLSGVALAVASMAIVFEFCSFIGALFQNQVASFSSFPCFLPLVVAAILLIIGSASFIVESEACTIRLQPIHIDGIAVRFKTYRRAATVELAIVCMIFGASIAILITIPPNILAIALLILDACTFILSIYMLAISKEALQEKIFRAPL